MFHILIFFSLQIVSTNRPTFAKNWISLKFTFLGLVPFFMGSHLVLVH